MSIPKKRLSPPKEKGLINYAGETPI